MHFTYSILQQIAIQKRWSQAWHSLLNQSSWREKIPSSVIKMDGQSWLKETQGKQLISVVHCRLGTLHRQ